MIFSVPLLPTAYKVWGKIMFSQVFVDKGCLLRRVVSAQRRGGVCSGGAGKVWYLLREECLLRLRPEGMSAQRRVSAKRTGAE